MGNNAMMVRTSNHQANQIMIPDPASAWCFELPSTVSDGEGIIVHVPYLLLAMLIAAFMVFLITGARKGTNLDRLDVVKNAVITFSLPTDPA
jgi:hypothetical protein